MARRYFLAELPRGGRALLAAEVSHHLARVVRARAGDRIVLFDGRGREAAATVAAITERGVEADVEPPTASSREPAVELRVAVALPKGARADWLLEHGTEVGIRHFHPLRAARSQRRGAPRNDRADRIVRAAAGQCDRAVVPTVWPEEDLAAFLGRSDLPAERYVAAPIGPPLEPATSERAILAVGPEGGFTAEEEEALAAAGFLPRSLGPLTLRTETAALVGAAILLLAAQRGVERAGPVTGPEAHTPPRS
jgi:16S rRNA (uracil1498-N3)-methyltransferase